MMLAFMHLNQANPEVEKAERYAQAALSLVPDWHYVRDLLLPQIYDRLKAEAVDKPDGDGDCR